MQTRLPDDTGGGTAWIRFQDLLTALKPGQRVTINGLAARSGLAVESVGTVLEALTRAELFLRIDAGTFVRDSLTKQTKQKCA